MKKLIFYTALIILSFQFSFAQFPTNETLKSEMDEAMKNSDLPAVVATAINRKGERLTYTFGKAVWTENEKVTADHIFRIYSMTKLFTSIAAMQLVEKGKLQLDDDLSTLLPEMTKIPILLNGELKEGKNPITLRHLLTHTSGFGYNVTDKELFSFDMSKWQYKDAPRRFESGTAFLYGTSTDWVGRLVEKVSGLTLEEYFRKNICQPLRMNRTWFDVPDSLKNYIVSYGNRGSDGKQPLVELPNRIPSEKAKEHGGGGGLFSSPKDYTILLECMLHNGKLEKVRILKKSTVREMNRNQIGSISMENAGDFYFPMACCDFKRNNLTSKTTKWGFACLIDNEDKPYGRKAGTVLWGGLYNTLYYIDYKSGITATLFTQNLPFNNPQSTNLFDKFSELIYMKRINLDK